MNSFFSELKKARVASGFSLGEISDATLISMKMLEALERGDVNIVPQAYVRAFIREYAGVVGLAPDETMKKYDAWLKSKEPVATEPAAPARQQTPKTKLVEPRTESEDEKAARRISRDKVQQLVPTVFKIVVAILVLVLVDIVAWTVLQKEPAERVKETPFGEIVRDNEERAKLKGTSTRETSAISDPSMLTVGGDSLSTHRPSDGGSVVPTAPFDKDSLTLTATTTDSVWMQLVVDNNVLTEHFLFPRTTTRWRAKDEFWISAIGNPNGLKLTLNTKLIAIPMRRGYVTRDLRLNRDSLAQLQR